MIDGIRFISENYERVNNLNDREIYKELYHPDILWCPPGLPDKAGVDLVAFSFALKNFDIKVEILELEGINGETLSYVTGLCRVDTFSKDGEPRETFILRGSWVVVLYDGEPKIRYQVWNRK